MADLPTISESFGASSNKGQQQQLPTLTEAFAPEQSGVIAKAASSFNSILGGPSVTRQPEPYQGSLSDYLFSHTAPGRVLSAFGQGFKQGWGSEGNNPIISQQTEKELRDNGMWNDYKDGHSSVLKSANEAWMRWGAANLETLFKPLPAVGGAISQATGQLGQEIKSIPVVGQPVGEILGGIAEGAVLPGMHGFVEPRAERATEATSRIEPTFDTPVPFHVTAARANGIIGEGESGYFGTREASPEEKQFRNEATGQLPEEPGPVRTVESVARQNAPEVFSSYDETLGYRNYYKQELDKAVEGQLDNPRIKELNDQVETILSKVKGDEDRLTGAASERLRQARQELEYTPHKLDTPEIGELRAKVLENQQKLWDMSKDVSAAYRIARDQIGEEPVKASTTAPGEPVQDVSDSGPVPTTQESLTPVEKAIIGSAGEPSKLSIQDDVAAKLIKAGRPADEAQAAGALWKAHYEARAKRFQGKLGSGRSLYEAEGPNIVRSSKSNKNGGLTIGNTKNTLKLFNNADPSTIIHETGHQWLEELLQDGAHKEAPEGLLSDVSEVKKWLKVKEGQKEITRKQHEQWARGFERYVMEGTAPTKRLAKVFEQFKSWLSQIYQSVLDLKSPINDNIRNVFDRLLSNNDTTILPDELRGKEPLGRPTEAGPGTAPAGLAEGPDTTGATGEPTGVPDQSGSTVSESSTGPIKTEVADPEVTPPIRPKPAEGTYIDGIGKIKFDLITDDATLQGALKDIIEANKDYLAAKKGKRTTQDIMDLGEALGQNPSKMESALKNLEKMSFGSQTELSSTMFAVKQYMKQSAQELMDIAKLDPNIPENVIKFDQAKSKLLSSVYSFLSGRAEWGRTGLALQLTDESAAKGAINLVEALNSKEGRTLFQQMELVKSLDTPEKVIKFTKDTAKPSFGEMMMEAFKNGLISGPITHATYAIGNKFYAIYKAVPLTATRALIGRVHEAIAPLSENEVAAGQGRAHLREIIPGAYAMLYGQRDGLKAAYESFKAGQTIALPGEDLASTPFSRGRAIPGVAGVILRAPGERMVAPIHSFDRTVGYLTNRSQLIVRTAINEGLEGEALHQRIAELQNNTPDHITKQAVQEATEQALMGRPGDLTSRILNLTHWEPVLPILGRTQPLGFLSPFVTVASNINKAAILDMSPVGLAFETIRNDMTGKEGRLAQDTAIAKMALGTALYATVGGLVLENQVNPSADKDFHKAAIDKMTKGGPHTIRIGDMAFQLDRLGILGAALGLAADTVYYGREAYEHEDYKKAALGWLVSIKDRLGEEGFMSSVSDVLKAVDEPDRYGQTWGRNFVTSAVPFGIGAGQIAQRVDPYQRDAKTLVDAFKKKIPFVSEDLYPQVDIWGQPIPNREYWGVYADRVSNDPVNKLFDKLGYYPAPPKRDIRSVKLTPEEYFDFATKSGTVLREQVNRLASLPNFDQLSGPAILETIKEAVKTSREQGASFTMMRHHRIMDEALKKKQALTKEPE